MKSYSSTISVNPSTQSMGEKYTKTVSAFESGVPTLSDPFRSSILESAEDNSSLLPFTLKFIWGVSGKKSGLTAPMDAVSLISRVAFGGFLLIMAALGLGGVSSILTAIVGVMVITGFMTRASLATFASLAFIASADLHAVGLYDINTLVGVTAVAIAILGPGHSSIDTYMERFVARTAGDYFKRKELERRDSYKAFMYTD